MNFLRRTPPDESSDDDESEAISRSEEETDNEEDFSPKDEDSKELNNATDANDADEFAAPPAAPSPSEEHPAMAPAIQEEDVDEDSDEDSYDTESDEDSEPKKRGWFGFLRRNQSQSYDETDSEDESDDEDHAVTQDPVNKVEATERVDLESPQVVEAEEEEIAQAIQRVQQRIADYRKKQVDTGKSDGNGVAQESVEECLAETLEDSGVDEEQVQSNESQITGDAQEMPLELATESSAETMDTQKSEDNDVQTGHLENDKDREQNSREEANEANGQHTNNQQEDETPSLSERRSLLSLAAEHNRVDVIKELMSMTASEADKRSLLQGVGGHTQDTEGAFIPPPLHAAVAQGSVDAASCLLRMGADPSLRPLLPNNHTLQQSNGSNEDRNYKKYHGRSAWELAFGALVKIEDGHESDEDEEVEKSSKGWFGFGGNKEVVEKTDHVSNNHVSYKQISGLNIPAAKIDGIHHAFTAEALRAIGSDEVDRLSELLDGGMTPDIEVAGKTLKKWSGEMDAAGCLALMMRSEPIEPIEISVDNRIVQNTTNKGNDHVANQSNLEGKNCEATELDEQLASLSRQDIITLIIENESLIPALTSCRDDLAEEIEMCRNVLRDIKSTGGKGGLASRSLLDLVRSLKEDRVDLEALEKQWQEAWEEREDELDWFWEEAISDEVRDELAQSEVLDSVVEPLRVGIKAIPADATFEELANRYHEATNRVSTLRAFIASLAEDSGRYKNEIESSGLGGALSLVRTLRGELKELQEKISQAQTGESNCRRKIALIQKRIGHPVNEEGLEDYQLNAIIAENHQNHSLLLDSSSSFDNTSNEAQTDDVLSNRINVMQQEHSTEHEIEEVNEINSIESDILRESYNEASTDDDESSNEDDYENIETAVDEVMHKESLSNEQEELTNSMNGHYSEHNRGGVIEIADTLKQSQLRESGMSTAIVVRYVINLYMYHFFIIVALSASSLTCFVLDNQAEVTVYLLKFGTYSEE